jgi:archaellum component FlaC
MSRRKRRGDNTAPSLFPFLAVLLCTIGALILILAITVTNTHASARKDAELAMEDVKDSADFAEVVTEELAAQRENLKTKIEQRRRDLADIEDHIERLKKNLEQLLDRMETLQSRTNDASSTLEERTQKLTELRQEIDAKKKELLEEIEKQKRRKPAFAIIPYSGNSGTSRRPVYIECTPAGIVLQPEGILIAASDLKPPLGPGNPLDAALRVLRVAYQQRDVTFGMTQPPYPLLLVRPDGIQTYALAREAMNGWDDQFGYELIGAEMELKFPMGVPGLREELENAIALAKQRQKAFLASMPRNVVMRDETWDSIDAMNSAPNTLAGGGSQNTGASNSNADSPNQMPSGEMNSEWKLVQGIANEQVVGAIERNGLVSGSGFGQNNSGNSGIPNGASMNTEQGFGPMLPTSPVEGQFVVGSNGSSTPANGQGATSDLPGTVASSGTADNRTAHGTGPDNSNPNATSADSAQGAQGGAAMGSLTSNGAAPPMPNGPNAFSAGSATGTSLSQASPDSNATSDPASNTVPSATLTKNVNAAASSPSPSQPKAKYVNPEGDLKPISVSAGKGWAASRAEGKATPVARQIYLVALKDRWLLRSDTTPTTFDANITMDEGPQQAGSQLALAIRKRVDSWGLSLPGGYWAPALTIEAASDAQQSVARLEKLLEGSGVVIQVVPLKLPNQR